jgi:hypothetical protein
MPQRQLMLLSVLIVRAAASVSLVALLAAPVATQFSFEPPLAAETGPFSVRTLVGDVDEDGLADLVSSPQQFPFPSSFSAATLCFGLGDGQFGAPQPLPIPQSPPTFLIGAAFGLADFDADGHLDVLIPGGGPANAQAVSVSFGDGRGGFGPAIGISTNNSGQNPDDADVGDFNGDGWLDVAVHRGIEPFLPGRIMVILGDGKGGFDAPVIPVPFAGQDFGHQGMIRVGDANGDGLDDIVYTTGHSSPTLLSQGDGTFVPVTCPSGCGVTIDRDFVLADVNGDGRDDAVTNLRVLLATPGGAFEQVQVFPSDFVPLAVAVEDLDADGTPDVVLGRNGTVEEFDVAATVGDVLILRGDGNGTFQTPGVVVSHVPQPRDIAFADIDLDGRPDIVVAEFQNFDATRVLFNRAYGPGALFLDLGGALAGSNGYPIQIADGTLIAGQPFSFRLVGGPWNGAAFHVVGIDRIDAPFKGGTMIPSVDLVNGPFQLDFLGGVTLGGAWPAGASGLTLYLQYWMPQAGGPAGFAASSGVRAEIP